MYRFKVGDKIIRSNRDLSSYPAGHRGTVITILNSQDAVIDTPISGMNGAIRMINWDIFDEDEYSDQEIKELVESAIGFKQINELEGEE